VAGCEMREARCLSWKIRRGLVVTEGAACSGDKRLASGAGVQGAQRPLPGAWGCPPDSISFLGGWVGKVTVHSSGTSLSPACVNLLLFVPSETRRMAVGPPLAGC